MKEFMLKFLSKIINAEIISKSIDNEAKRVNKYFNTVNRFFSLRDYYSFMKYLRDIGYCVESTFGDDEHVFVDDGFNVQQAVIYPNHLIRDIICLVRFKPEFSCEYGEIVNCGRYLDIRLKLFTKECLPVFFSLDDKKITTIPKMVYSGNENCGHKRGNNRNIYCVGAH